MAYDLQLFTNNAVSLLASPISASATNLTVMAGYGTLYPNPGPGQYFLVTLEDQAGLVREIIRVNGRSGDTFTGLQRGQEGTTPQAWSASLGTDTLVDHRVTAETMRLAMLLPEQTPSLEVQLNGTTVGAPAETLNFVGDVTISGAGATKTIDIGGGAGGGTGAINGDSPTGPTQVDPAWTISVSTATYTNYQRGFKFFVTIYMPANHRSCTFEVLGNVSGDLGANAEEVTWNRTARVGYNFLGAVNITLNTATKELNLTWQNGETNTVQVLCTRIQHLP